MDGRCTLETAVGRFGTSCGRLARLMNEEQASAG
jgi:hypothetical protein